ncbi:terminase large subunit [Clostridium perfringens]|nr:terminase large subunit [Clostridium perfringens]ELC8460805.1 terminase large subunit [Clostridium perfringens]
MILLEKAFKYANDVISGEEVTTWEVKKQCEIFLNDYNNRQFEDNFEFYLDEKKLKKINDLLKLLNFATGFVAGKQILENLANFQAFFIVNIFGWRFKNKPYKFRYNNNTLFIARKNAKTALVAIIFILLMLTEQNYSEFYSICLTKELAAEIKKAMEQIINASPLILKHFKISTTQTGRITCKITKSYFEPRVSEAGKNNSIRPSAFVSDEHGNFKENSNFTAMKSGQKNVLNGLVFRTTTAYAIDDSIMEEDLKTIRKVLKGEFENERMFSLIYYAEEEHIWDDTGLLQANPLRVEDNYRTMKEDRALAKIQVNLQEDFITKTCNVFVKENEYNKYVNIEYWKKCRIPDKEFREKVKNKNVIVGIDLSVTTDLTAVAIMFKEDGILYCTSHGFLPGENLDKRREDIDYRKYEELGYCDIHNNRTVQYSLVEKYIRDIENTYDCTIEFIVTDPMNAKNMVENLEKDFDVIKLKQTYTNLTSATKEFRKKIYDYEVRYAENELLDWNMSNAITHKGKSDDEMLAKEDKNKQRIDMVAALIFCYTQLIVDEESYNPFDALEKMDW